jgi:hypothetical protein
MYVLTATENLAVQARLNFILGRKLYDHLFLGFECGKVERETATVFVHSEYNAIEIALNYQVHVAIAIESIIKRPIRNVSVLPKHYSDSQTG